MGYNRIRLQLHYKNKWFFKWFSCHVLQIILGIVFLERSQKSQKSQKYSVPLYSKGSFKNLLLDISKIKLQGLNPQTTMEAC